MISSYSDLINLVKLDTPDCADPIILQSLQQAGREFCRLTERWHEKLTYNIVDCEEAYDDAYDAAIALSMGTKAAEIAGENAEEAARDYILKSHYDAEIIRPWKVWDNGDESEPVLDPASYRFVPSTSTLTFNQNPRIYSPTATTWATLQSYTVGTSYVINSSLRYVCAITHTSGTFATDLAAYKWKLVPNDLIVKVIIIPRLTCNELAAWFMDKWAEGIMARAKEMLMVMKNKSWSSPERVPYFHNEYNRYVAMALRERCVEDKSTGITFATPSWTP